MNADTYICFFQNEYRSVTITVRDQDHTAITPTDASSYKITNCEGTTLVEEDEVTISGNTLSCNVSSTITATVGDYFIIWKVVDSDGYTYYHRTHLEVKEIFGS